jgi:hypothetical protein
MIRSQGGELHPMMHKRNIGINEEAIDPLLRHARKGRVDLATTAGNKDVEWPPDRGGRRLQFRPHRPRQCQEAKAFRSLSEHLVQKPEPLPTQLSVHRANTGGVSARPIEAGNKTDSDRSAPA